MKSGVPNTAEVEAFLSLLAAIIKRILTTEAQGDTRER